MKRILHLCSNRWNSAICEYVISSMKALNLSGFTNTIVANPDHPVFLRAKDLGDRVSLDHFGLSNLGKLQGILRNGDYFACITYGGKESTLLTLTFFAGQKIRFFGDAERISKLENSLVFAAQMFFFNALIVPSQLIKARCKKSGFKSVNKKIEAIPIGIDTNKFSFVETSRKHIPKKLNILIFGRLDPVKGHLRALKIFAKTLKLWEKTEKSAFENHLPDLVLKIVGLEANLQAIDILNLASELKIHERVEVTTQHVEDVSSLFSECDLGWVSSLGSELICRVAQEFSLCGLPIFVSDAGSLPEVVLDPSFGVTYKNSSNDEEIAAVLVDQLKSCLKENHATRRSRSLRAQENFSIKKMSQLWSSVFWIDYRGFTNSRVNSKPFRFL